MIGCCSVGAHAVGPCHAGCNYHPPRETRRQPGRDDRGADPEPKDAAIEFQHDDHAHSGRARDRGRTAQREVKKAQAACDANAPRARQREDACSGDHSAVVLEGSAEREIRVTTYHMPTGPSPSRRPNATAEVGRSPRMFKTRRAQFARAVAHASSADAPRAGAGGQRQSARHSHDSEPPWQRQSARHSHGSKSPCQRQSARNSEGSGARRQRPSLTRVARSRRRRESDGGGERARDASQSSVSQSSSCEAEGAPVETRRTLPSAPTRTKVGNTSIL